ncbi:NAD(P)/FAD-dependent oxidoreductase [Phaeobacter sp. 22II1-1F12B]|uniref:NAD(P)/FAD-dependent oxidoreductase n=1 Tax=Phaeobacter sp. 22II1-1F12B TaxID=1317111 RepID=UPI000B5215A2|nr:NAD(P)/FAD-dependent oxidoreductase [Phaeobacter sp. 22II1-1F12B]OWU75464.1 pyridine nucleotide-disulfide oxidoreductase [Phaeobacter sp. 22II1-1F12B]
MFDAVVVGGSFAGLSAGLQLARASRSVLIIDDGHPRNRTSPAAHGVPGWDGVAPAEILARFRSDLRAYPTVSFMEDHAEEISGKIDDFIVTTGRKVLVNARRILLAHGIRDILPDLPGLVDAWGRTVLHCPYCHGYEVKDRPLAVLATGAMAAHQAHMLRADWSHDVTLLVNGVDGFEVRALETAGIKIEHRAPLRLTGDGDLTVRFQGGPDSVFAAIFTAPRVALNGTPTERLGVGVLDGPMGPFVRTGPMQQTDVPGVFAAGDLSTPMWNVNFAVGDGARAGAGCHQSLLFPNFIPTLEKEAA